MSGNPNITDESITNLIKGCYNLEIIHISNCPKLTDASLFSIAANCPNLGRFFLSFDNIKITVVGLIELLKNCQKLNTIESHTEGLKVPI